MIGRLWGNSVAFGFRLLYNEMAFTYDAVSYVVSLGDWRQWQLAPLMFLPAAAQGRVLELAHGTGHLQQALHEGGYQTVGYDLSGAMGRIARARLQRVGAGSQLVQGRAQTLPFADHQFAAIACTFPTSFIADPRTLSECWRVLAPKGMLVIVLNGVLSGNSPVKKAIDGAYRVTGQGDASGIQPFTDHLAAAGFMASIETVASRHGYAQLIVAKSQKTV